MTLENLLKKINDDAAAIEFDETIAAIDGAYNFTPSQFANGSLVNKAGENSGSCKIFAFAKQHGLTEEQTLHCFGRYYREEVLENPQGDNHQNIRNFLQSGWAGITFEAEPLSLR
ncbi:MAG: HopJ type III effector protein [Pseudomonadales bacterium]|nr:HopJ type III effector protein [Pseudomonadales bacterium]MCP5171208.1 HopJ type III effector protein [Pseudomonadales bacterium]MCP5301553.1 HopJ type III effector protein [Pseudomonadales bacterium]